ncbi:hypothetical protein GY45DRAFT_880625 [Cubamyces sp. BRFM 1775]|nr:hypothetical protein GY45DRAFT_880625 [Cubamyces sp. BRFM 1775]
MPDCVLSTVCSSVVSPCLILYAPLSSCLLRFSLLLSFPISIRFLLPSCPEFPSTCSYPLLPCYVPWWRSLLLRYLCIINSPAPYGTTSLRACSSSLSGSVRLLSSLSPTLSVERPSFLVL